MVISVHGCGGITYTHQLAQGTTSCSHEVAPVYVPAVAQDMKRRGQYGHIINISSMSGHRVPNGASGGAFYAATKHALRALTEGLRQEVGVLLCVDSHYIGASLSSGRPPIFVAQDTPSDHEKTHRKDSVAVQVATVASSLPSLGSSSCRLTFTNPCRRELTRSICG